MKIKYNSWQNNAREFDTVKRAVQNALTPDVYSYEGQLEKLSAEINKLQEMVASLVECRYGEQKIDVEQLQDILGYGYEVGE